MRNKISVSANADEESIKASALENDKVKEYVKGKKIIKTIVVPKRLINIVTGK